MDKTQEELDAIFDQCEALKALENAPATLEDAIQRIMRLETALDDLARATEIAQFSKQYHLANTYIEEAEELLKDRIIVPEIEQGGFNLTVVEGNADDELVKRVAEQRA